MQVRDVMNAKPSYCEPHWTVEAVAALMAHVGTGILPVVESVLNQRVLGVVTDRDLCVRAVATGLYPAHTWVRECMTLNPICCSAHEGVEVALRLMRKNQVRRLPVVDADMQLRGMLSISDLVRSEAADPEAVYETLRLICRPCVGSKTELDIVMSHVA
ncbi:MAG TPA: CBS domain-containing protein [Terriglobales bacterium]